MLVAGQVGKGAQRWLNLGADAPKVLEAIKNDPNTQDKAAVEAFGLLMATKAPPPEIVVEPEGMSPTMKIVLIVVILVVVGGVGIFAIRLLRPTVAKGSEATPAQQAAQIAQSTQQTNYADMGLENPITQSMTSYVAGDDLYDESFSIESPSGEFMGEFGVGISDTVGVGDPKKVSALEVWLFDKNDIKTATKVLMSEHTYNDPNTRQRLEAKGELVLVEPRKQVLLETETLQLLVTIADLDYGTGPLPPSSYFNRATLELAIWPRNNG